MKPLEGEGVNDKEGLYAVSVAALLLDTAESVDGDTRIQARLGELALNEYARACRLGVCTPDRDKLCMLCRKPVTAAEVEAVEEARGGVRA